jgi:hypothetical protein
LAHDLAAVDTLRARMGVGYEAAVDVLDETQGDVVRALAHLERQQRESLAHLTEQVKEGVTRSLQGDTIGAITWKVQDHVVTESPVKLSGVVAAVVGLLSILISSSAIETAYTGGRGDGPAGS